MSQIKGTATNIGDMIGFRIMTGFPGEYGKWAGFAAITESQYSNNTGMVFFTNQTPRVWLTSTGRLGIGISNPNGTLEVNGNAYIYGALWISGSWYYSDKTLKRNIATTTNSLQKILELRGVSYNAVDSIEREQLVPINPSSMGVNNIDDKSQTLKYEKKKIKLAFGASMPHKNQYGFIAQEVEKIFPDLVATDSSGIKSVNYISVIPILVEAIKELNAKNEVLDAEIMKLKKQKSTARTEDTKAIMESVTGAYLYQNNPNPFSGETQIKYYLPETTQSAFITITDLNGKQVKLVSLSTKGEGSTTFKANELQAGMYIYTLVADGNIVDSKRMIIVE